MASNLSSNGLQPISDGLQPAKKEMSKQDPTGDIRIFDPAVASAVVHAGRIKLGCRGAVLQ